MKTMVTDYEYREMYRKRELARYKRTMMMLYFVTILLFVQSIFTYIYTEEQVAVFILLLPILVIAVSIGVYHYKSRLLRDEDFASKTYDLYKSIEDDGIKIPIYRYSQRGKEKKVEDFAMVVLSNMVVIYKLKKGASVIWSIRKEALKFEFSSKFKHGEYQYTNKFILIDNGKKRRFLVMDDMKDKFYKFIKESDLSYAEKQGKEIIKERK